MLAGRLSFYALNKPVLLEPQNSISGTLVEERPDTDRNCHKRKKIKVNEIKKVNDTLSVLKYEDQLVNHSSLEIIIAW